MLRGKRRWPLLLLGLLPACGRLDSHSDCRPAIVLTPAPTQGQAYRIHVGDVVMMNLTQLAMFCTVVPADSARWESTNPEVAAVSGVAGPTTGQQERKGTRS